MSTFWKGFEKAAASKEVATVALINVSDKKMLMGKRRDNKKWTNPGGHLENGEDPLSGAVREVKEETGIDIGEDDLIKVRSRNVAKPDGTKLKIHAYKAFFGGEKPRATSAKDPDKEVSVWRWVKTKGGLPRYIQNNLHVPLKDNVLLSGLRLHKTAAHRGMPIDREAFNKLFREAMQQYAQRGGLEPRKREKRAAERIPGDRVAGGLADRIPEDAFDPKAVEEGKKVELEHTDSPVIAREIARDHLTEDRNYYKKLKKIEKR